MALNNTCLFVFFSQKVLFFGMVIQIHLGVRINETVESEYIS